MMAPAEPAAPEPEPVVASAPQPIVVPEPEPAPAPPAPYWPQLEAPEPPFPPVASKIP